MNTENMTDRELLQLVVGEEGACELDGQSLGDIFSKLKTHMCVRDFTARDPHEVLMAAKELFVRGTTSAAKSGMVHFDLPKSAMAYLAAKYGNLEHEVFACLWLDAQSRMIDCESMFRGTVSQTAVYPREVVKQALAVNAQRVILCHNHPSGVLDASRADITLTQALKSALALIDVFVVDHIIVSGSSGMSMAEIGLL
jgi:DNA repair protein RadC